MKIRMKSCYQEKKAKDDKNTISTSSELDVDKLLDKHESKQPSG